MIDILLFLPPLCLTSLRKPTHPLSSESYAVFCSLELFSQTQKTDTQTRDSRKHSQEYFVLKLRSMGHSGPHRELSEEDHKFKLTYRDHVPKKRKGEKKDRYPHRSVWIHEFGNLPLSENSHLWGKHVKRLHLQEKTWVHIFGYDRGVHRLRRQRQSFLE